MNDETLLLAVVVLLVVAAVTGGGPVVARRGVHAALQALLADPCLVGGTGCFR